MSEPELKDELIKCRDCNTDFKFTVRDQQFYAEMGFKKPKRCRACRDEMKKIREQR